MATPDPTQVAPWYLRNITQALALDEVSGNVYMRTGITGNIIITGNVTVPAETDAHITAVGTLANITTPYLPVGGNVTVFQGNIPWTVSNTNVAITSGNVGIVGNIAGITSNINIGTMPEVEIKNDAGNAVPISGNVNITNITAIPVVVTTNTATFYQFNNFGLNTNRGWTMSNSQIPMFAVRVKPGSGVTGRIGEYEIGNNNANQSTIGYVWFQGATITGAAYSWVDIGSSGLQYAIFTDDYGSNTPNGITGGTSRHSGIIIGKNSNSEVELAEVPLTDGGPALTIAVQRLDSATKLDIWFAVTIEV